MKKLLLSLGALSAVVAPVAAVVACGSKTETPAKPIKVTSTKTLTELKAVTAEGATNAADWSTKLGVSVSSAGTTTFTWDVDALTLTENQKVAGKTLVTILAITPKVVTTQPSAELIAEYVKVETAVGDTSDIIKATKDYAKTLSIEELQTEIDFRNQGATIPAVIDEN